MKLFAITLASLAAGFSPNNRLSLYKRNLKRALPVQDDGDILQRRERNDWQSNWRVQEAFQRRPNQDIEIEVEMDDLLRLVENMQ